MLEPRPELIFLAGPQTGRRAVLMGDEVLVGRLPSADVRLSEPYASRRQMRFQLTRQGWLVENLSASGTRINGKRYKRGQMVLLATGDVLAVGEQTELLFVGPGEDPDSVLAAWRLAHPQPQAEPAVSRVERAEAAEAVEPPPAEAAPTAEPQEPEGPPTVTLEAEQRKKKFRKYAIAFGIYAVVFAALIVLLVSLRRQQQQAEAGPARRLTTSEIEEALLSEPTARPANAAEAEKVLQIAVTEYYNRHNPRSPGARYHSLKAFKEYLAYAKTFAQREHDEMYSTVRGELIRAVDETYRKAILFGQAGKWPRASQQWDQLARMVPEKDKRSGVHEKLVENILAHMTHARSKAGRR